MPILTAVNIKKSFADRIILDGVSFDIERGERVGLIGKNGSGKTTLLKIITGDMDYDSGNVSVEGGARVEVLAQIPKAGVGESVASVIRSAFNHLKEIETKLAELERDMATDSSRDIMERYDKLRTLYETIGGYEQDVSYNRTVSGLAFTEEFLSREFNGLSGGEKTKVNLARIILSSPDLLLLDEPTNHLDMRSIEWIEEFLANYKGTVLLISHDRYFLDRVATRIIELAVGGITSLNGNYSEYMEWKEAREEQLQKAFDKEQTEINRLARVSERLLGWGIQTERLSRAALSMRKRLDKLRENRTERMVRDKRMIHGVINDGGRTGFDVLSVIEIAAGYDSPIIENVNLELKAGERVALLGDNGAGKTTFFKLLTGEKKQDSGRLKWGANVKVGHLPQTVEFKHTERNLVDTVLYAHPVTAQIARDRLAAYDFRGEDVFKLVKSLSGGELSRLKLCLLSFEPINLFLLDEPTNHLDIDSREWIENTLEEYDGAMIFVSHDRYFISRFAGRIWAVGGGTIKEHVGDFESYRQKQAETPPPKPPKQEEKKAGQPLSPKAIRNKERKIASLEKEIEAKEKEIAGISKEMENSSTDYEALEKLTQMELELRDKVEEIYAELEVLLYE